MPAKPHVTVILPFHNAAPWLSPALRSLRIQRDVDLRVVAIDDGSTDQGYQQVEREASLGLDVTLIRNETNLGIVASLNRGIDLADTQFIARMDADDICMPGRLARQATFLSHTGCDLCGTWFTEFGQGIPRTVRWPHTEDAVRTSMLFQNTILHPSVMARREVLQRYRYREDSRLVEDYDLFVRILGEFRVANVPSPLLRYRRHPQQATQAKRDAMEVVNQRIRIEALRQHGFDPSPEECHTHQQIRAPQSIRDVDELRRIEIWLQKLIAASTQDDARLVIASQWVRSCIRAAPLGRSMWKMFKSSSLSAIGPSRWSTHVDLAFLAATKLDYRSHPFSILRRLGLSA